MARCLPLALCICTRQYSHNPHKVPSTSTRPARISGRGAMPIQITVATAKIQGMRLRRRTMHRSVLYVRRHVMRRLRTTHLPRRNRLRYHTLRLIKLPSAAQSRRSIARTHFAIFLYIHRTTNHAQTRKSTWGMSLSSRSRSWASGACHSATSRCQRCKKSSRMVTPRRASCASLARVGTERWTAECLGGRMA
jgi:hypothetical protein